MHSAMAEIIPSRHLAGVTGKSSEPKCAETASEIEAAAAAWAAKADRGELAPEEQAALEKWLGAGSRRVGAYARALAVNAYFDRAAALGSGFSPSDFEAPPGARPIFARRKLLFAGAAAMAASVAGIAGYGLVSAQNAIVTAKGDMRRVTLAEGSAITLNTDSRVEPRLEERLRQVRLLKGEALFDVSRDRTRPFVVEAGDVRVRVLGTRFSVRRFDDGSVEVGVLDGVVEVGIMGGLQSKRLIAGQRSRVLPRGEFRTENLPQAALERAVGWRHGILDHWMQRVQRLCEDHQADLEAIHDPETRVNFICEKNVLAQVRALSRNPFVTDAWRRGQSLSIPGWIYSIRDGLVRDLETTVSNVEAAGRLSALSTLPRRRGSLRTAAKPRSPGRVP